MVSIHEPSICLHGTHISQSSRLNSIPDPDLSRAKHQSQVTLPGRCHVYLTSPSMFAPAGSFLLTGDCASNRSAADTTSEVSYTATDVGHDRRDRQESRMNSTTQDPRIN